jgi:hypothetical protein
LTSVTLPHAIQHGTRLVHPQVDELAHTLHGPPD